MGNNLIHINAEKYYDSNLINLIIAREEVFLNLYYEENKIKTDEIKDKKLFPNSEDNSKLNHEIIKKYDKEAQIEYINSHKLSGKLKRYIKTTLFFNFNIPEIQEIVNEKIHSKNLFDESRENIIDLNIFGFKLFNIVQKYVRSVLPEDLKFIADEPLFFYYANQLYKPLIKENIIDTVNDFFALSELNENEISEVFNVKCDNTLKEQINEVRNLKKSHSEVVKKYYDIENRRSNGYLQVFILISSIIVVLLSIFLYKVI